MRYSQLPFSFDPWSFETVRPMGKGGSDHADEISRSLALRQSGLRSRSAGGIRRGSASGQPALRVRRADEEKICVAGVLLPGIPASCRTAWSPTQLSRSVDLARPQILRASGGTF